MQRQQVLPGLAVDDVAVPCLDDFECNQPDPDRSGQARGARAVLQTQSQTIQQQGNGAA